MPAAKMGEQASRGITADQIVNNSISDLPDVDFEPVSGELIKFYHRGVMKFEAADSKADLRSGLFILTNAQCGILGEHQYGETSEFLLLSRVRFRGVVRHYIRELQSLSIPGITDAWMNAIELKLAVGKLGGVTTGSYFVGFIPNDESLSQAVGGAIRILAEQAGWTGRRAGQVSKTIVIEREIVKIPCRYCGTLNEVTERTCSNCGASIR